MTAITGTYTAPSATNLTQSINRTGSSSTTAAFTPIDLTTASNYSKSYTATFALTTTAPTHTSLTATTNGLSFTRVGDTYTLSSIATTNGVAVNNWAYFKKALRTLSVVSDPTFFPNPACSIAVSISDGTTSLTGTTTVNALTATVPSTPGVPTLTRDWETGIELNWTASTQAFGPGVAGYYVYRNGTASVYDTVLAATTYLDTSVIATDVYTYQVQAFDASGVPVVSAISGVSDSLPVATIPTTPTGLTATRNWGTNVSLSWTGSTQAVGSGVTGYYIYKDGSGTPLVDVTSGTSYLDTSTTTDPDAHSYTVKAHDGNVIPLVSLASTAATTPAATTPTTVTASIARQGASTERITWTASIQTTGPGIGGYFVYRDGSGTALTTVTSGLTYDDTTAGSTSHTYTVKAYDLSIAALLSGGSNTVTGTVTTLSTPTAIVDWGTNTSALIIWTAAIPNYPNPNIVYTVTSGASTLYTGTDLSYSDATQSTTADKTFTITASDTGLVSGSVSVTNTALLRYITHNTTKSGYSYDGTNWTDSHAVADTYTYPTYYSYDISSNYHEYSLATDTPFITAANYDTRIKYGNGVYITLPTSTSFGFVRRSTDGTNWSEVTATNTLGASAAAYDAYKYDNSRWVALSRNKSGITSTDDGATWTAFTYPLTTQTSCIFQNINYTNGNWVAIGQFSGIGHVIKSTNGTTWTEVSLGGASVSGNVVYFGGNYITLSDAGTTVYYSTDLVTWNTVTTGPAHTGVGNHTNLITVNEAGDLAMTMVLTTTGYKPYYSADGLTWSPGTVASGAEFGTDVIYGYRLMIP